MIEKPLSIPITYTNDVQSDVSVTGKILNKKEAVKICISSEGYRTPGLNDILYFHSKGYTGMYELEEYNNVKTIYFNNNCLSNFNGMHPFYHSVVCLYLQTNLILSLHGFLYFN